VAKKSYFIHITAVKVILPSPKFPHQKKMIFLFFAEGGGGLKSFGQTPKKKQKTVIFLMPPVFSSSTFGDIYDHFDRSKL